VIADWRIEHSIGALAQFVNVSIMKAAFAESAIAR
jgi:hypothetical protein